jgi:hypothetical protein
MCCEAVSEEEEDAAEPVRRLENMCRNYAYGEKGGEWTSQWAATNRFKPSGAKKEKVTTVCSSLQQICG